MLGVRDSELGGRDSVFGIDSSVEDVPTTLWNGRGGNRVTSVDRLDVNELEVLRRLLPN